MGRRVSTQSKVEMIDEENIGHIALLSFLAILWWRCAWSLLDELYEAVAKHNAVIMRTLNLSTLAIVSATFYYHPAIIGRLF